MREGQSVNYRMREVVVSSRLIVETEIVVMGFFRNASYIDPQAIKTNTRLGIKLEEGMQTRDYHLSIGR